MWKWKTNQQIARCVALVVIRSRCWWNDLYNTVPGLLCVFPLHTPITLCTIYSVCSLFTTAYSYAYSDHIIFFLRSLSLTHPSALARSLSLFIIFVYCVNCGCHCCLFKCYAFLILPVSTPFSYDHCVLVYCVLNCCYSSVIICRRYHCRQFEDCLHSFNSHLSIWIHINYNRFKHSVPNSTVCL